MTRQDTIEHSPRTRLRRILAVSGALLLTLAALAGVVVAGAVVTSRSVHQPVPTYSAGASSASLRYAQPARSTHPEAVRHGRRLVVAFVVGTGGTIASDLLAPYDIFASSPVFTTYVVAADAAPAPLEGGPAVVPTYTFADVDANPALRPDLVVVPGLTKPTGNSEALLRSWVTRQHDDRAKVLGVCSGSMVLAATGMLDGLHATSHWSRISALQASRPAVDWVRGRRWVEDGSVTTTAAVTSGVPAALHLVAELAGSAEARRVADLHPELGWTPAQSTTIAEDHFAVHDWPVALNFVMPWFRPTIGIALNDGVGELDATAAFEVYGQSAAARTVALATGETVRTQHGLSLLTTPLSHAPRLSRLVVPGGNARGAIGRGLRAWADNRGLTVEPLAGRPTRDGSRVGGGGFSAALHNLAEHTDAATTSATAKMVGYPVADLNLGSRHRSWRTVLLGVASLALAGLVGLAPARLVRLRRRRSRPLSGWRRAGTPSSPSSLLRFGLPVPEAVRLAPSQPSPTSRGHRMPRSTQLRTHSSHRSQDATQARTAIAWGALARHYVEMVIAMVVGMMVLQPLWTVAFDALALPDALKHATVMALVMATDMSLGMGVWMRYRGHSWRSIAEMTAAMYLPFAMLVPLVWAGVMVSGAMLTAGHLLMLLTMLALMLWRRREYGHGHHSVSEAEATTAAPAIAATEDAHA